MPDVSEPIAAGDSRERIFDWARRLGIRLTPLVLEGGADGMIPALDPRHDLARFGPGVFRSAPRRGDLLIVAGTVSEKMAPLLRRLWDELPEPKWAIALGSGGPCRTYAVVREIGRVIPVDVHLPGWPPRPEDLLAALLELEKKIAPGVPG
jgi:NADH-quinone oxidoreductase subunit B